jgi:phage repressor protein C with HTH and peptisase S24 domain
MAELAKAAGYKHASGIQRYEDPQVFKDEYLPLKLVKKIAQALVGRGDPPLDAEDIFTTLAGIQPLEFGKYHILSADPGYDASLGTIQPNVRPASGARVLQRTEMPMDIPVQGIAVCGRDGDFSFNGETVDHVRRPPGIATRKGVFAIYAAGDSMSPWRQPGDPVYVDSVRPARIGDYVIVECYGKDGEPGPAFLKKLVGADSERVRLAQFNPPTDKIVVPKAKVRKIFRVIDWAELLGI